MEDKLKNEHHESATVVNQYAGLSPEDVELAQRFEGKEGKRVVRKVCCDLVIKGKNVDHC